MEAENGPLEDHFPLQTGGELHFHVNSRESHSCIFTMSTAAPPRAAAVALFAPHCHRALRAIGSVEDIALRLERCGAVFGVRRRSDGYLSYRQKMAARSATRLRCSTSCADGFQATE